MVIKSNAFLDASGGVGATFNGYRPVNTLSANNLGLQWNGFGIVSYVDGFGQGYLARGLSGSTVMSEIAAQGTGGIGTLAFLAWASNGAIINPDTTHSGANLCWAGFNGFVGSTVYLQVAGVVGYGTWRAMGYAASDGSTRAATLFMRIS